MASAKDLNESADRGTQAIKNITLRLKANWSNLDAWLMKQRNNMKGLDLIDAFTVKVKNEDGNECLTNALLEDKYLSAIAKWTQEEAQDAWPIESKDRKIRGYEQAHQRVKNVANMVVVNTVDDDVITAFPPETTCVDPAVNMACIKMAANPIDNISNRALCHRTHDANIRQCGGLTALNFARMAKALRKAQSTLRSRGEIVSDDQLLHSLMEATPDANLKQVETAKATLRNSKKKNTFDEARALISGATRRSTEKPNAGAGSNKNKKEKHTPSPVIGSSDHQHILSVTHKKTTQLSKNTGNAKPKRWKTFSRGGRGVRGRAGRRGGRGRGRQNGRSFGRGRGSGRGRGRKRQPNDQITCCKCGCKGHHASECRTKMHEVCAFTHGEAPDELERVEHSLHSMSHTHDMTNAKTENFTVVGDSGCTHDVFNKPEHFNHLTPLKNPIKMDVGHKGVYITVTHTGDVPVMVKMENGEERKCTFVDAFHSRECSGNFASNSLRDKRGWKIISKNRKMAHCDENDMLQFIATMEKGLHRIKCRSVAVNHAKASKNQECNVIRVGHRSVHVGANAARERKVACHACRDVCKKRTNTRNMHRRIECVPGADLTRNDRPRKPCTPAQKMTKGRCHRRDMENVARKRLIVRKKPHMQMTQKFDRTKFKGHIENRKGKNGISKWKNPKNRVRVQRKARMSVRDNERFTPTSNRHSALRLSCEAPRTCWEDKGNIKMSVSVQKNRNNAEKVSNRKGARVCQKKKRQKTCAFGHEQCEESEGNGNEKEKTKCVDMDAYHCRFGHIGTDRLRNVPSAHNLKGKKSKGTCIGCDVGKTSRARISTNSADGASRNPLRLHSDVKTLKTSVRGFRCFVVFTHEESRCTHVNLMKKKSEVSFHAKSHMLWLRNKGIEMNEFRSDGGGECTPTELQVWLKSNGILWNPSAARTPEHNSIAERSIRSIMDMSRCMSSHADMPDAHWCHAVQSSVCTLNRTPHKALKGKSTSPIEMFSGHRPDTSNLRTFGCTCACHIDKEMRNPGGPSARGEHARFLACDDRFGTCTVQTKKGKIKRTRVTKFHENEFAFPRAQREKQRKYVLDIEDEREQKRAPNVDSKNKESENDSESSDSDRNDVHIENDQGREMRRSKRENRGVPGMRMGFLGVTEEKDETHGADLKADHDFVTDEKENMSVHDIENTPKTYDDAMSGPERNHWMPSTQSELKSLRDVGACKVVTRPKDRKLMKCKCAFKKKTNATNNAIRCKTRCVAKGCAQEKGVDHFNAHAPTLSLNSTRVLLAISATLGLKACNLDVKTAFLHGEMDVPIYVSVPKGLVPVSERERRILASGNAALELKKCTHGLHQAAHQWLQRTFSHLKRHGFTQLHSDGCMFHSKNRGFIVIGVCVDDVIACVQHKQDWLWLKIILSKEFEFRDVGETKDALGVQITRTGNEHSISQSKHIEKMCEKCKVSVKKRANAPITQAKKLCDCENSPKVSENTYRSMIGAVLCCSVATRPDIAHAVSTLARFSQDPRQTHYDAAKRLMVYMLKTKHLSITCGGDAGITACADASCASCPKTLKSVSGHCACVSGGPVTWKSRRQTVVATSTAEAECMASSECSKEITCVTQMIQE